MDQITHQRVSTVYQIPFKLIENFVKCLARKFLLSRIPVTFNQGQSQ